MIRKTTQIAVVRYLSEMSMIILKSKIVDKQCDMIWNISTRSIRMIETVATARLMDDNT